MTSYLVANDNGFVFKRGDEKDLAMKLIYLLNNEVIMKKFGENSKEYVKKFSRKRIA